MLKKNCIEISLFVEELRCHRQTPEDTKTRQNYNTLRFLSGVKELK